LQKFSVSARAPLTQFFKIAGGARAPRERRDKISGRVRTAMNALRATLIVGLALLALPTEAKMVLGPGAVSCVTWSADRQRNEARSQLNQSWVLGFVTGYIVYRPPQLMSPKPMDSRAMMLWIDNFCDAYQEKDIYDAAKALIEELTRGPH
jgi:hypothetical protein